MSSNAESDLKQLVSILEDERRELNAMLSAVVENERRKRLADQSSKTKTPLENVPMEPLIVYRSGTDLGPVLGSDARLPRPPRCDLCGDEPVLRGPFVQLGDKPRVWECAGLSEEDRQVAVYRLCATCWATCSTKSRS
jgi:hypothetical protein